MRPPRSTLHRLSVGLGLTLVALLVAGGTPTAEADTRSKKPAASGKAPRKPAKRRKVVKPRTVVQEDFANAPSFKYGAMTKEQCLTELRGRKVSFTELSGKRGVLIPIRLDAPVHGVTIRTELPAAERKTTPYEVMDCRLALAAVDFAQIVAKHDIAEVHIFSAWRPPPESFPADGEAIRHPGGLALDVRRLVKSKSPEGKQRAGKDAASVQDLVVDRDWTPVKGQAACPAPASASAAEKELRAIFCEAKEARIFTSMLSPNYDADHKNHFHLEVRPKVKWTLVL